MATMKRPIEENSNHDEHEELVYFPSWVAGRPGYADRIRQLFQEYHQSKGMRMTQQRGFILDYLLKASRHVGMEDIYRALRPKGVGRVTVFRALKMLEEAKLIDRVTSSDGKPRFEVKYERPHHDHLICVQCGAIQEIQWPQIERIQEKTCRALGFLPIFHRHEIFGTCKNCQKQVASRSLPVSGAAHG
jgi:Fur family ferric uptake transcriptional regulator